MIEYLGSEEQKYERACEVGDFLESAIKNEPRPLKLPDTEFVNTYVKW